MKAAMLKTAAVASLFLLGAATLHAQRPDAFSRPESPQTPGQASEMIRFVLGTKKTEKKAEKKEPKQAVSEWKTSVDYSGPRFGFTYLPQEVVDSLKNHN